MKVFLAVFQYALVIAICLASPISWAAPAPLPQFELSWGHIPGSEPGRFNLPLNIDVDIGGNVYVADCNNSRVQKFDGNGTFLIMWGTNGEKDGQFTCPTGIAVDHNNNVYVTDSSTTRIQKFNTNGVFLDKWAVASYWSYVDVDQNGNVYVLSDHQIQKFTSNGGLMTQWGNKGTGIGEFSDPRCIAVDANEAVYICDHDNSRIQIYTHGGTFIKSWNLYGKGIDVDSNGSIYITDDRYYSKIKKLNSHGKTLVEWGSSGYRKGQFHKASDIAVDHQGNIFVLESGSIHNRIQKFTQKTTSVE